MTSALPLHDAVSRPAIVKHLRILDRAGLVRSRRAGREVLYYVRLARLDEAVRRKVAGAVP